MKKLRTRTGENVRSNINRVDLGVNWNRALEADALVVGETLAIDRELEALRLLP